MSKKETMEEKDGIIMDKGLSMRSEEVNEIMGDVPHWLTRWGMVCMLVILLGFGIGAYTFTVPEYVEVPFIIKGGSRPIANVSVADGKLVSLIADSGSVEQSQQIALFQTPHGDIPLSSPVSGLFRRNLLYHIGENIEKGDTIGWTLPWQAGKIFVLLLIPEDKASKVSKGQVVLLMKADGKDFVRAKVKGMATVVVGEIMIGVVEAEEALPRALMALQGEGRAKILVSKKRLIDKILVLPRP